MSESTKFGSNHARGMLYQGLSELGNALTTDSTITQRHLENGVWGNNDSRPPTEKETAIATPAIDSPASFTDRSRSVLDQHIEAAKVQSRAEHDLTPNPERQKTVPEMERD